MSRCIGLLPLLVASALSAQVPAPAPVPPAPAAPVAPPPMAPAPPPEVDIYAPMARSEIDRQVRDAQRQALEAQRQMMDAQRQLRTVDMTDVQRQMNEAMANANIELADRVNLATNLADIAPRLAQLSRLDALSSVSFGSRNLGEPDRWFRNDPADSLYREARDLLNSGDYRKAAALFKSLPTKYPNSAYIGDAQYWEAFSLYRIGGTPELQEALAVLEARNPAPDERQSVDSAFKVARDRPAPIAKSASGDRVRVATNSYDVARKSYGFGYSVSYANGIDAAGLAARIASVLSSRGLGNDPAVKKALASGGNACDPDDQSVRAEALNALMQANPATGRQMAMKILADRDDCSVPLRRNAVMLVASKGDDAAVAALIPVAKSDPAPSVRLAAMEYLAQMSGDLAINAVIELARTSDDPQIQLGAVNALAQSSNARARAELKALIENQSSSNQVRAVALSSFGRSMSGEDASWLEGIYARTTDLGVRVQIISAVARAGGQANQAWLMNIVRDENESQEVRSEALNAIGRQVDVNMLIHMYDVSSQRQVRDELINLLGNRNEPQALDKLVDIAKNGTDPSARREAIGVLAHSKDPRASALLLQLVDQK